MARAMGFPVEVRAVRRFAVAAVSLIIALSVALGLALTIWQDSTGPAPVSSLGNQLTDHDFNRTGPR